MNGSDPKELVRRGYDDAADRYAEWIKGVRDSPRLEFHDDLVRRLTPDAEVLELGVGGGVRSTRELARLHHLTGVDFSQAQLARAQERVPGARLIEADMTEVAFEPESFDAVVALYTLTHLPREDVPPLLSRIASWLRCGGWFLATFGARDNPGGVQDDWIDTPMFFSGHEPAANRAHVERAGFAIVREAVVEQIEPEQRGPISFHWILARKP